MSTNLAACVLIERHGLVLGISRFNNPLQWGLIAGKVDKGETPLAAAKRELEEETGIDVRVSRLHGPIFERKSNRCTSITFRLDPSYAITSRDFSSSDEGLVAWITWPQLFAGPFGEYNIELFKHLYKKR